MTPSRTRWEALLGATGSRLREPELRRSLEKLRRGADQSSSRRAIGKGSPHARN